MLLMLYLQGLSYLNSDEEMFFDQNLCVMTAALIYSILLLKYGSRKYNSDVKG
jgi:hypothetical protein